MEEIQLTAFKEEQIEGFKQAFICFKKGVIELLGVLSKVFKRFNIDENYLRNIHMAKYSKKKRIRKKYLKKLIK